MTTATWQARLRVRSAWLARPWFFVAVALLLLNDHVFKQQWPGVATGKLSDFAGLLVVATLVSVLVGRSSGVVVSGVAFVVLKTVPGTAELVAPLMGGAPTLRDPSDLVALLVLPPLWHVLGRHQLDQQVRNRRGWAAIGLVAAVLATTATTIGMRFDRVDRIGLGTDGFYARVDLATDGGRWIRSDDGGGSWTAARIPVSLARPQEFLGERTSQQCAADGVCYRIRPTRDDETSSRRDGWTVERQVRGGVWTREAELDWGDASYGLSVNPENSSQAVTAGGSSVTSRNSLGRWTTTSAGSLRGSVADSGSDWSNLYLSVGVVGLLTVLSWFMVPWPTMRWVLLALNILICWVTASVTGTFTMEELWPMEGVWAVMGTCFIAIVALVWRADQRRERERNGEDHPAEEP